MACVFQLQVEILHLIFEAVKGPHSSDTWVTNNRLARLARVCKHWLPIAKRLLYQSVAIGFDLNYIQVYARDHEPPPFTDPGYSAWLVEMMGKAFAHDDVVRPASSIVSGFLETIQKNQMIAAFVTELTLRIPNDDRPQDDSHQFIKILAACPNVRRLKIIHRKPNPNMSTILMESLMSKKTLIAFELEGLEGVAGRILWETSALLRMMGKWREIEHVNAFSYTLSQYIEDGGSGDKKEEEDVELGCCPKLQSIDLDRGWQTLLRCRDLRTLLRMCPTGMKTFKAALAMDDGTLDVLEDCIRAWAPTLETLVLRKSRLSGSPTSAARLSDCVANLTNLKVLVFEPLKPRPHIHIFPT